MTISVVGTPSDLGDTGSQPFDFGATHTSSNGANRALIVCEGNRSTSATNRPWTDISWNSVAMTIRGDAQHDDSGNGYAAQIADLIDPAASLSEADWASGAPAWRKRWPA